MIRDIVARWPEILQRTLNLAREIEVAELYL
jgi:hypothetical protein